MGGGIAARNSGVQMKLNGSLPLTFHTLLFRVVPFQLVIVIDFYLLMKNSLIFRNSLSFPDSVLRTRLVSTPKSIWLQSVAASV